MTNTTEMGVLLNGHSKPPPRRIMIRFLASPEELAAWEQEKERRGFNSLSDFLREGMRRFIFEKHDERKIL